MPIIKFIDKNGNVCESNVGEIISIDGRPFIDTGGEIQELKDRMLRQESQMEIVLAAMYANAEEEP